MTVAAENNPDSQLVLMKQLLNQKLPATRRSRK